MLDHFQIHPDYRSLLDSAGLTDFEAIMGCKRGKLISRHRRRDVTQLEFSTGSQRSCVFLKRDRRPRWKDLLSGLLHGLGWATKARWEWRAICNLKANGFACAEPIAFGQQGLFRPHGFLVLAELKDAVDLPEALAKISPDARRTLLAALAREIARLHNAGFEHRDLYSKHIWISQEADGWGVCFLDLQRTRRRWAVLWRRRLRDLSALNSTLDTGHVSRTERLRFLRIYLESSGRQAWLRRAVFRILRRTKLLHARRTQSRRRFLPRPTTPRGPESRAQPDGKMWIHTAHREHFRRHGLDQFDAVMHCLSGDLLRRLPDRENWRLSWPEGGPGQVQVAYLKRHREQTARTRCRALLNRPPHPSPGSIEARYILDLERAGITTMPLLAYGERLSRDGVLESFVLTEEIANAVPLDTFLRQRFPARTGAAHRDPELRHLVDLVADTAQRFHTSGYNHRDFYCCHFLIREPAPGEFGVHLIDLQRVQRRRYWRSRWIVKDLAQLSYSAPETIGPRVRLAFLKRYLGVSRLRLQDKRLIRRILAKQRWIARHGYPP